MPDKINIEYKDYTLTLYRPSVSFDVGARVLDIDLRVGSQGPPGPPGAPGGQTIQMIAGQNLSAGRAVVSIGNLAYYFQPSDLTMARGIVGVTKTAALTGDIVDVQVGGEFVDIGLALTPDAAVFVGSNGVLTSTPPASGLVLQAGVAITPQKMILRPSFTFTKI